MSGELSAGVAGRTVRTALIACGVGAAIAIAVFAGLGRPLAGLALAVGLVLGSVNSVVAARLISVPIPFFASSLARIITLSMIGLGIGFALGRSNIWLVILGLAASQFLLAASALRQVVQR